MGLWEGVVVHGQVVGWVAHGPCVWLGQEVEMLGGVPAVLGWLGGQAPQFHPHYHCRHLPLLHGGLASRLVAHHEALLGWVHCQGLQSVHCHLGDCSVLAVDPPTDNWCLQVGNLS
ncbi:hypothetical protein ID866_11775 [Astraeus odoratus]|nr:hypothetical protein ID866_11775 [Astraeus odoratus]